MRTPRARVGGLLLALVATGCAAARAGEMEVPDEEQSCGGTGEEEREGQLCPWPAGGCEVAGLGPVDVSGRVGALQLSDADLAGLEAVRVGWTDASGGEALALSRDADGRLRALVGCRLEVPLRQVESGDARAGWALVAAQLLVSAPDPAQQAECAGATHFVAAAWGRQALALPLACPPLSSSAAPRSCVGAGLDGAAREAWARALYDAAQAAYQLGDYARAFDGFLTLRALLSDSAVALGNLGQALRRLERPSCAYRDELERARRALPESLPDGGARSDPPEARCVPAPPLLGCLPGFPRALSADHC